MWYKCYVQVIWEEWKCVDYEVVILYKGMGWDGMGL